MKPRPARSVAAWIVATPENLMHLSVITIGEIRKGIDLLDENEPKRGALQSWLDHDLRVRFAGRLLSFDEWVAERWGQIEALAKRQRGHASHDRCPARRHGASSWPDVRHAKHG